MEKYSCTYANTKSNFVFQNIEELTDNKYDYMNDKLYGIYCVIQNIIQRGTPSKPSEVLINKLGNICVSKNYRIPLITEYNPVWRNTIKGDEQSNDNPAEKFYNEIYSNYMKDYAFTKQLILPEANLSEILEESNKEFKGQQVDFYLPQADLVIEIDGSSHNDKNQVKKDIERDKALNKAGIQVIRIKPFDIKNRTPILEQLMKKIYSFVESNFDINVYKKVMENDVNSKDLYIMYDIVIRFQMLILTCLKHGIFKVSDKTWQINIINSDYENISNLIILAYEDVKEWIRVISRLNKINIKIPDLKVIKAKRKSGINVDFSIYKRWTDEYQFYKNCVFIRNDYYDNKDYYSFSTSNTLQYKINLNESDSDVNELKYILRNLFGYNEFRDGQLPIIINVLERHDTIGILPTGTGKSLCYQFAAILQPGISIVVAPIISLMMDQKENMDEAGMTRTAYISGNLSGSEKDDVLNKFMEGKYELVWISPERFQNEKFRKSLLEINRIRNFALAVIDEVHCLSEWGHDFRTSYLTLIRTIRDFCPEACLLGLTATASQAVLEDLKNEFNIESFDIKALSSMNRDELVFLRKKAERGKKKIDLLDDVFLELEKYYGENVLDTCGDNSLCGLVFTPNKVGKNGCIEFAGEFERTYKKKIGVYHGSLNSEERKIIQNEFMSNKYNILTCTKAFGMGINKKNIKYTVHFGIPQSIESFYQEAGRAGRDNNKDIKSFCYILYQPELCKNEIIEKIFSASTTVDERKDLCSTKLRNDLSSIMFLWNLNRHNVDEEYYIIRNVLKNLYQGDYVLHFEGEEKSNIELALYKLSILGIVSDWVIDYQTLYKGSIEVIYIGVDENQIKDNLLRYIRKYDVEFRLDSKSERYKKYYDLINNKEKPIANYIKLLLTWGNDNILYQRLQSTYNMLQLCDTNVSNDDFRRRLDYYFRYSETTIVLEDIVYHPKDYKKWFQIFYDQEEYIITKEKADNIFASLQRYLESYRNNTGLNFISGLLRLLTNQYQNNSDGELRLKDSFTNIKEELNSEEIGEIIRQTLLIGKDMDAESKCFLSELICDNFPDKSRETFNLLNDNYSLSIELEKSIKILNNIMEEHLWNL